MLHNLKNKMKSLSTLFTYTWCYFLSMCITLWYIYTEWQQDRDRDRDRDEDWDWDQWFVFCMCLTLTWNASDQIRCWIFCPFIFKPEEEEPDHGEFKIVGRKICLVLAHANHANIIHLFHLPCQDKLMFCIYYQLSCDGFQLLSMCEKVTPLTMNEIFECSAYKFPRQTNNLWKF